MVMGTESVSLSSAQIIFLQLFEAFEDFCSLISNYCSLFDSYFQINENFISLLSILILKILPQLKINYCCRPFSLFYSH
jgi:hypothetical protein